MKYHIKLDVMVEAEDNAEARGIAADVLAYYPDPVPGMDPNRMWIWIEPQPEMTKE